MFWVTETCHELQLASCILWHISGFDLGARPFRWALCVPVSHRVPVSETSVSEARRVGGFDPAPGSPAEQTNCDGDGRMCLHGHSLLVRMGSEYVVRHRKATRRVHRATGETMTVQREVLGEGEGDASPDSRETVTSAEAQTRTG